MLRREDGCDLKGTIDFEVWLVEDREVERGMEEVG